MSKETLPALIFSRPSEQLLECTPATAVDGAYLAALAQQLRQWPQVEDALYAGQTLSLWLQDPAPFDGICQRILRLWQPGLLSREHPRLLTLEIHYDGEDLPEVARRCRMSPAEVIDLHSSVTYQVAWLGFLPGFAYLDGLPEALHLPRRENPRLRVPVGSLAIAGSQSALYPTASPGGWHLLGRCRQTLFDASRPLPSLFQPGDRVRFIPAGDRG